MMSVNVNESKMILSAKLFSCRQMLLGLVECISLSC